MGQDADIQVYCNYEHPGGIERVSLRLRDFLLRQGFGAGLISVFGDEVFGEETSALGKTSLAGRTLVFSRKGDLREMGWRARGARLVYWRHVPVTQTGYMRLIELVFIAYLSRRGQIVCVCDDLASEIAALPFVIETSVSTCYSPVGPDLPERVAIRPPREEGPLQLVYFGRPSATVSGIVEGQKRLGAVLWQVANARKRGVDVECTVYGYEEVPDGGEMEGVRYVGSTTDPLGALRVADAVILISDYEGFPTIMVEAALTGTPIIANGFRTGRADFERLVGPVTGIAPGDPNGLVEAMGRLEAGHYNLSALSDEVLAKDWLGVLGRLD